MAIQTIFDDASSLMTVISFATFISIVAWTYLLHKRSDFDAAASLPFADAHLDEHGESGDV
ncbi:cytochrome C oxidase Cbb3 [Massilia sp. KIM]|uniref:cbb3-type cytochrome oxidase subunit 3 n=1 Tax=Massilia sp. KIM TaxID=1955422 RepID=UPI00098EFAA0|nr:cbb3-type cytochrome c oxidase subunit 3 [Massilia sp. KIM]OON62420.1 cytochrome C oxidase Cbb3 [Massilia sp. KIM]